MSKQEQFERMRTALHNILEISRCDFAKHQAGWGLGLIKREVEARHEETEQQTTTST